MCTLTRAFEVLTSCCMRPAVHNKPHFDLTFCHPTQQLFTCWSLSRDIAAWRLKFLLVYMFDWCTFLTPVHLLLQHIISFQHTAMPYSTTSSKNRGKIS